MRFNVSMQNFRCFASVGPVTIAPITLLIGENSSGKTSFLAGLRQVIEAFRQANGSAFNREPYFLGSFEQISHYRGGKAGRAKNFCLSLDLLRDDGQQELFPQRSKYPRATSHKLTFSKGTTKPELTHYEVSTSRVSAEFDLSGARPRILIKRAGEPNVLIEPQRAPASSIMRQEIFFLGYYLQEFMHRTRVDDQLSIDNNREAIDAVSNMLRSASRYMDQKVFASAPVRIQPRRVYTPSELTSLNAGEQVPLEMAREKIASAEQWAKTRQRLSEFGKKSGLFEDIDVKRLGKTDSDPFQLQIKNKGPFSNIVDVGYGVSQALPLLYPLQNSGQYDFYLLQQPEVHLHPRAQAEFGSLITSLSKSNRNHNYIVETHSDFIVDRIRSDVAAGVLDAKDVSILLFRRNGLDVDILSMGIDDRGQITGYPDDYRQFFLEEQARVLGL
jgi:hypothetical protein